MIMSSFLKLKLMRIHIHGGYRNPHASIFEFEKRENGGLRGILKAIAKRALNLPYYLTYVLFTALIMFCRNESQVR